MKMKRSDLFWLSAYVTLKAKQMIKTSIGELERLAHRAGEGVPPAAFCLLQAYDMLDRVDRLNENRVRAIVLRVEAERRK
jgi:hypothetical protein